MTDQHQLTKKYSDLVGKTKLNISDNFDLNYNYAIDQTLNDVNFSEIGMNYLNGPLQFNINYLEEKTIMAAKNMSNQN